MRKLRVETPPGFPVARAVAAPVGTDSLSFLQASQPTDVYCLSARKSPSPVVTPPVVCTWLSQGPLFLDTETTGLGNTAQALEIGLVNARGETVYHTRLKPTVSIEPRAAAVHGISEAELADAPSWPDVAVQLQQHIGSRPLVIFNMDFDMHILKQTSSAHNDQADWLNALKVYYAMRLSAGYYGATNRYGTISLASAAGQAGLSWQGQAHSALADAVMTVRVVSDIASYWSQLQREMRNYRDK